MEHLESLEFLNFVAVVLSLFLSQFVFFLFTLIIIVFLLLLFNDDRKKIFRRDFNKIE